ncbi:MAG: ABC transporter permease [Candidatus Omnitrophica bacterium]|nr:ABC transporter permease [Candidatus Omnitrophota bacterium]
MKRLRIYEPDSSIKKGFLLLFPEIFKELKENSYLTWQLFKRDFTSGYKQYFMGFFWSLVIPLVTLVTVWVLNRSGIFIIGESKVPYPLYVLSGMAFWQLFSGGLIAASNSLVNGSTMINRINFCRKSLVIASLGQALISFLVQMTLVVFLFAYYRIIPPLASVWVPLMIIPLLLLALGLGFIFSLLTAVVRDVANALSLFLSFLVLLTPILYHRSAGDGILGIITRYNPLYYLISAPRDMLLFPETVAWKGFILAAFLSVFVFFNAIRIFHLAESKVTERF